MDNNTLNAFLSMQDISTEEQKLQRQQAMADQLREASMQSPGGKDWGSQGGRALQGVASVLSGIRARKAADQFSASKQNILDALRARMQPTNASQPYVDDF